MFLICELVSHFIYFFLDLDKEILLGGKSVYAEQTNFFTRLDFLFNSQNLVFGLYLVAAAAFTDVWILSNEARGQRLFPLFRLTLVSYLRAI